MEVSHSEEVGIWEHLIELRNYALISGAALLVGASITHIYRIQIIEKIFAPLGDQKLVFLSPLDPLLFVLKVDFYGGLFLAMPVVAYCILRFTAPALRREQSRLVAWFCALSILLLVLASAYTYLLLIPLSIQFLISIHIPGVENFFTADQYLGFAFMQLIIMIGIFQLPCIILLLVSMRLLNPYILSKNRGLVWVIVTIALAVITPTTDMFTLLLFLVPTLAIFELSILIGKVIYLRNNSNKNVHDASTTDHE